ncbi:MAG: SDR family oxidoreductase [Armatimonadota bacterium]|nr:SDR family oxidoreductase [Armatimonadota bacterium]
MSGRPVLVTGATGYVGGRLVPELLRRGYRVRAAARAIDRLRGRPWASHPSVELVEADVLDPATLRRAADGTWAAYYLVHSMSRPTWNFADADRAAARNMAEAAAGAGLERMIYLGGLGDTASDLSEHLRSRAEVADVLRSGPVPVTVLRAAMIIGSGSASFEILRHLVERLPVMITPRWVATPSQPIAISNVLAYLVGCLERPETAGETYDIGGPDRVTYRELMEIYAGEAGLPRPRILPVPVLTPGLSSYWVHLVTPVPAALARPLAEGLRNPMLVEDGRIRHVIPQHLLTPREAIRRALTELDGPAIESHWSDAMRVAPAEWTAPGDPAWTARRAYTDRRRREVDAPPEAVWGVLSRIGGETGWYGADWLWRLRGVVDRVLGGVGLRRRAPRRRDTLMTGDMVDFWRVEALVPNARLLLRAEMRLPGRAWLEFALKPINHERTELIQTARFIPSGIAGTIYWYAISPLHAIVFGRMLRGIARASAGRPLALGPTPTS